MRGGAGGTRITRAGAGDGKWQPVFLLPPRGPAAEGRKAESFRLQIGRIVYKLAEFTK
jgi:hypothetical protein